MKTGENNPEVINMLLSKVQFLTHNITDIRMKKQLINNKIMIT